jgi:hypothetical protein
VRTIWEEYHSGSFKSAIEKAAGFGGVTNEVSSRIFSQILRAMEIAYNVSRFGTELLPKPKISILHRGLKQMAETVGIPYRDDEAFVDFLDDVCPCGLKRHKEAVRKLRGRFGKSR